ncbi:MAG: PAS domain S-box protein [Myxococcales bacterium]|nr:PAS domain S-box protein [Myxococcales bacterium]
MRVLAVIHGDLWRSRLADAAQGLADVCFVPERRAVGEALARFQADVVVLEGTGPAIDFGPLGDDPPEVLVLLEHASGIEEALDAGATDCEVDADAPRLRLRLKILAERRARLASVRAEAGALRMMTNATSGWRYWEFDIQKQRLNHALPSGPTERGFASEELRARGWDNLHTAGSRSLVRRAIRAQLEEHREKGTRSPCQLRLEMENADETLGHRLVTAWLGLDRSGEPTLWRGVTYDITDAVRAATSLATIQASFDALVGVLPLPVFTVDARGDVLSWNEAAAKTFGFTAEEVNGNPLPLIELGAKAGLLQPGVSGALDRTVDPGRETVVLGKDGKPVDVWIWTSPIRGSGGDSESTVFLVADITAKKQAELDYKQLFEAAHDAILVIDPDGEVVLDVNSRGCELYGMTRDEMIGQSLVPLSPDPERGARMVAQTLASGSLVRFETVQNKRDGTPMHLDVNASCVEYRGRRAILSINRDVTDRKTQEEALRRRDLALAEATRLDAVGRLAGGVAHDFNNLLMVIEGGVEALASSLSDELRSSEDLTDLEEAVGRAKALVTQLLTFANRARTEPRTLNLAEVVRRLSGILRRLVREDIAIRFHLDPTVPAILADPSQLEQVVINLVVNARDAIDAVGTIDLSVRPSASPGFVELSIRDSGHGMDEQTRSRMFEPFFTTKAPGKGTGLGLATVHGIVRGFGGEVKVTSAPGQGTEICIVISEAEGPPSSLEEAPSQRLSRPGAECILLVEDERAVRRILSRQLQKLGYQVLECQDGVAALELARDYGDRIDMLVTDVVMPRMGGDELAAQLRAERPDVKILFMSGHMEGAQLESISSRGLGPILAKPFGLAQLTETVRRLLES